MTAIPALTQPGQFRGLAQITVIQVNVEERAFGTSAGYGELLLTIRGEYEPELDGLRETLEAMARKKADIFPETRNHPQAVAKVREAAQKAGVPLIPKGEMLRASEDFGYYTKQVPGAMFYLGNGDAAPLPTARYDFPDRLIETAASGLSIQYIERICLGSTLANFRTQGRHSTLSSYKKRPRPGLKPGLGRLNEEENGIPDF